MNESSGKLSHTIFDGGTIINVASAKPIRMKILNLTERTKGLSIEDYKKWNLDIERYKRAYKKLIQYKEKLKQR